jgi:capsular polysaccharide transport system permease protein
MTTKLKLSRFRIRKPDPVAPAPRVAQLKPQQQQIADDAFMPDPDDDGFAGQSFLPPDKSATPKAAAKPAPPPAISGPQDVEAIRHEGLTGRQLRMARRLAQKHGLPATSDFDAVRLLRKAGIDPFQRSALMELVAGDEEDEEEDTAPNAKPVTGSRALTIQAERSKLPQVAKPAPLPSTDLRAEQSHIAEVRRIQIDIVARRRRKLALMWSKIAVFVLIPTFIAGWYYFFVATPMYSSRTEFVIQQATASAAVSSLFTGTSFATSQDSVAVQGYLQSQDVMELLDQDTGFRTHFSDPTIDPIQRLAPDANNSATYALYKKMVKISYDPTEGLIKLEVSATDPDKAVEFSRALLNYAELRVDQLTARLRGDQEKSAAQSFADAQTQLERAQLKLVELQQKTKTFSSEVEVGLITSQIGTLDAQLTQERLALAQMEANANPNKARMDPVKTRIVTLESQINDLRQRLTESSADGPSIAAVQSELVMAQADVATRQMMLAQATSAMETTRIEAGRQTRYLSIAVQPVAADDPSYPRAFENTLVVMLIFGGIYLMVSMTIAILREQVSN